MKKTVTTILALAVLAAALPAQENLGRGRISGEVVDSTGAGVPAALIVAQSLQSSARLESKTDKKGHFAVGGLGSGTWRITASKDGYVSAYTDMPVSQLRTNPPLALTLKSVSEAQPQAAEGQGRPLLDEGQALLDAGRYDDAIAVYERFAAKYPEVYGIELNIATAFMKKGDLDRAETEFRQVLDRSGLGGQPAAKDKETALRALSGLGELALKRGDLAVAQEAFRKALEISPQDAAAAYNVGEILFSNQKVDEAITYLELAVKIRPDWPKAYHRLGLVQLNKGDFDGALRNLRKFVELDPQNPEAGNVRTTIAAVEKMKK